MKTKNCTSCQSLSVTSAASRTLALPSADAPLYCFYLRLCKNVYFIFEQVSKREQMQRKTLYNLLVYINADYKWDIFSRVRLYCTPAGTHFLRHTFAACYQTILIKSPGLSVVSDPRNVLRHKQERLTLQKLGFLICSMYNDGIL